MQNEKNVHAKNPRKVENGENKWKIGKKNYEELKGKDLQLQL